MFIIRSLLRILINIIDLLFAPSLAKLPEPKLKKLKEKTQSMTIYQFKACPFCVKLRWKMRKMGIVIPFKDAKNDPAAKSELMNGGGKVQVPCLRYVENGKEQWLYESKDIAAFLHQAIS